MKTFLKPIISGLLILPLILFLAISFIINKKIDNDGEIDPSKLTFFYETYDENRKHFKQSAASIQKQFRNVEISKLIVRSDADSDLSIDTVYIPAQREAKKLIIMSSGVHGIEGFTGSAVQRYFMSEVLDEERLQNMGVLLIHAINPYGFKYERRVSENNVDMNRNFHINKGLFARNNEGYTKIHAFLNPPKEAKPGYFRNGLFFIKTAYYILKYKMKTLRQSTLEGQYEFKNGIFYGGTDFEMQKGWLEQLILEKTRDYEYVFVIDLHTGYGERGELHFLPGDVQDEKRITLLETMFKDFTIDRPNTERKFIIVRGGFRDYVGNLIHPDRNYIGTVFEFGTLDSHKTVGSVRSLHNMILENQGFHHGFVNSKSEKIVKKRFREMFFPSSETWRSRVMKHASEILPVLIDRYAELNS
jgi:predicted deacylase